MVMENFWLKVVPKSSQISIPVHLILPKQKHPSPKQQQQQQQQQQTSTTIFVK